MAKDRILEEPQSVEAERAVVGSMILDRDAISKVVEIIDERCFYLDSHRILYRTIVELYDKNIPVDILTLSNELKSKKELSAVGDAAYITELLESVISSANVVQYAKIVRDSATLRDMIKTSNQIIESAYQKTSGVDELVDKAEQLIFNVKEQRVERGFVPIKSVLTPTFESIEAAQEQKRYVTGIPSGFNDLDKYTSGFQQSDLIIVAGRPSKGKSAFCLNVAAYLSVVEKMGVGIFSLEMAKESVVMRILCSEARVNSRKVKTGYGIKGSDWAKLTRAAGALSAAPIYIDDTPEIPILELRAKARRLKAKNDIRLIVVDYLQLVTGPRAENRQQEISKISRSLKSLSKELNVPVIAVSQLSRAVEQRGDKRPVLADLRESGAIEQDADVVLFIHRRDKGEGLEKEDIPEIIIAKHRNGPTGAIKLSFIKSYTRFENLAKSELIGEEETETSE